jgi:hypothetical protein
MNYGVFIGTFQVVQTFYKAYSMLPCSELVVNLS